MDFDDYYDSTVTWDRMPKTDCSARLYVAD